MVRNCAGQIWAHESISHTPTLAGGARGVTETLRFKNSAPLASRTDVLAAQMVCLRGKL